jgi:hypothetical protein
VANYFGYGRAPKTKHNWRSNWWGRREVLNIINIFQMLRGRGGSSRSLEGGALSGNSSYISYIWILNILESLGGGGDPAALWRVAHLMEIQVTFPTFG